MVTPEPTSLGAWAAARARSPRPVLVDPTLPPARIELSGRVLVNWWAKDLGLLRDTLGLGPGDRVLVRLPAGWRSLPLALATLALGAELIEDPEASPSTADLVITDRPEGDALEAPEVLAVPTAPLAVDFGAPLPAGVTDHAAEVRAHPDVLDLSPAEATRARWSTPRGRGGLPELLAAAAAEADDGAAGTVTSLPVARGVLAAATQLLATGAEGVLVLTAHGTPDDATTAQERITRSGAVLL